MEKESVLWPANLKTDNLFTLLAGLRIYLLYPFQRGKTPQKAVSLVWNLTATDSDGPVLEF